MPHRQPPDFESFRALCAERGLAVTHQRQVIFRALHTMGGHPSPEEVFEAVRGDLPALSLATVYKTIKTFLEAGLIQEVSLHHGSLRIEANTDFHHHLICSGCRAIVDLPHEDVEPVRLRRRLPRGFKMNRVSVEVIGLCESCTRLAAS